MPTGSGREVRIQKYLSRAGVASRRKSEELMTAGRVRVNGEVVTALGSRVDPERDRVEVDGRVVEIPSPRWIAFHKPTGVLTTRSDPGGRRTVYDVLPPRFGALRYVGRLDRDTEGLLILGNQGELIHRLLHPSREVDREYRVEVEGEVDDRTLRRLTEGVELEDGPARAERAERSRRMDGGTELTLVLQEGRKREVRRMMDAVGHPVRRLRRVRFGPIVLGDLPPAEWRELGDDEVRALMDRVGLDSSSTIGPG